MTWQDAVLTFGQVLFAVVLLPALRAAEKPPLSTSLATGITLLIFSATYASLSLWYSSACAFVLGLLWLALAAQRFQRE